MTPRILSLQVPDFPVRVQQALTPTLRDRPVVVVTSRRSLGRVSAASAEAREAGIHPGLRYPLALRACPDAAFLLPDPPQEARAETALLKTLFQYTPALKRYGAGRLFADTTGTGRLFGPPLDLANRIQAELEHEYTLPPAMGISRRALWSDLAGHCALPDGLIEVLPEQEDGFLRLIPPRWVPGVGPKTQELLEDMNIQRLHQLTQFSTAELIDAFGHQGRILAEALRPPTASERIEALPSLTALLPGAESEVTAGHALVAESNRPEEIQSLLQGLIRDCGRQLRARRLVTGRIHLSLHYSDGRSGSGSRPLTPPSCRDSLLLKAAREALTRTWKRRVRLCRLDLRCGQLAEPRDQLRLLPDPEESSETSRLIALDHIHERFGATALRTAAELAS
ncbi:MAG: DNA polymerase Y family protein [Planctomycetota bacterium]